VFEEYARCVVRTVSEMRQVRIKPYRFAYFLVASDTYENEVRLELERQATAFAEDMGGEGLFVQPFPSARRKVTDEVLAKPWPTEIQRRLENEAEPIILVVESDFADFDPRERRWAIIWLSDFEGSARNVQPMLKTLSAKTRRGEDVIAYLHEVADREENQERRSRVLRFAARAGSYIEWKPKLPIIGLGIDVKAVLRDVAAN
jgi:hypothetical protein